MNQKILKGRLIEYGDVVIHNTMTRFSFWDRIRILFGKTVHIQSDIYCKEDVVSVMGAEARTSVERFIKRKQKGGMECLSSVSPAPVR